MPRIRGIGKGITERINIRLDPEVAAFYRRKANEHGVSLSEYLRQTLVQGVITENIQDIEDRLLRVAEEIKIPNSHESAQLPDELLLSIFTTEALLTAIVESRDTQQLYDAQNNARRRLSAFVGAVNA
jgi:hypothetical protein